MDHVRNITLDIVLSLVTCGLYNLYWQAKQIEAVNAILGEDRYSFVLWLLLTLVTCGIYHIYHEYRMSNDLALATGQVAGNDGLVSIVLSVCGLSMVVDAIQQAKINEYYGDRSL